MQEINDYDMRQLDRMLNAIEAFLSREIGIQSLVGTLSFLLGSLGQISGEWKEDFWQKWGLLEILNAESREERRQLTEPERHYAENITEEVKQLIKRIIEK